MPDFKDRKVRKLFAAHDIDGLVELLGSRKKEARDEASFALAHLCRENSAIIERLIAELTQKDQGVRTRVSFVIAAFGDQRAVPVLIEALDSPMDEERSAAVRLLGTLGSTAAVEPLVAIAHTEENYHVRDAVAETLGELDDPRAVDGLIALVTTDKLDLYVVAEMLEIARGRGQFDLFASPIADAMSGVLDEDGTAAIAKLVQDGKLEITERGPRRTAVGCLGHRGDRRAVDPLVALLEVDDPVARPEVVKALEQIGDQRAVKPLIDALSSKFWMVRARSALALGRLGNIEAIEPLEQAHVDEHEDVRRMSEAALTALRSGQTRLL